MTVDVYICDLSSKKDVETLIPQIVNDGLRIDILLNCAGIQRRHPSHEFDSADWDEVRLRPFPSETSRSVSQTVTNSANPRSSK